MRELVIVRITFADPDWPLAQFCESHNSFYSKTMTKEELDAKALRDYPNLEPHLRDEIVAFVLLMSAQFVIPNNSEAEKCNTEPGSCGVAPAKTP